MILVDSNTIIQYLKGHEAVVSRLQAGSPRDLAIPSVVAYEIEYGTLKIGTSRRRELATELLKAFPQVPFDREAAENSARVRIDLESRGLLIGPLDLLIAGTALSREAALITTNTREFSRVKGLRIIDWTK
ncbi:MAG: PIN domain-containing protein [Acidobacteriaceae bacterium]|nr:PIN domain-containing protein [Acidobacteriaceae bacterium]MBV9779512.1 PIN domain-containing protein [Acidobacteriaceae bacterium]